MKQYRSTFVLYCIIWLCLVLLPAAYVLVRGSGISELRRTYIEAGHGLFRHLLDQDAEPAPAGTREVPSERLMESATGSLP